MIPRGRIEQAQQARGDGKGTLAGDLDTSTDRVRAASWAYCRATRGTEGTAERAALVEAAAEHLRLLTRYGKATMRRLKDRRGRSESSTLAMLRRYKDAMESVIADIELNGWRAGPAVWAFQSGESIETLRADVEAISSAIADVENHGLRRNRT